MSWGSGVLLWIVSTYVTDSVEPPDLTMAAYELPEDPELFPEADRRRHKSVWLLERLRADSLGVPLGVAVVDLEARDKGRDS